MPVRFAIITPAKAETNSEQLKLCLLFPEKPVLKITFLEMFCFKQKQNHQKMLFTNA